MFVDNLIYAVVSLRNVYLKSWRKCVMHTKSAYCLYNLSDLTENR